MVLADLGSKITGALRKLQSAQVIDEELLTACLKEISNALLESDVNVKAVMELRNNVKKQVLLEGEGAGTNKRKVIQKAVCAELVRLLTPDRESYQLKKGKANVVMFVGLQGSGKTTTCTKYAHYYQRKGWKTAMVCADTFRAGAFDQLKQNAAKARIPFYGSYSETDPVVIAEDGVELFRTERYELIIVDTSGRHRQESALFEEMEQIYNVIKPNETIFIMDSHIGQACHEQALAFRASIPIGSCIITKLDGHAKGGGALSAVAATNAPIIFLGTGEHTEDLERFNAESFVSRLLGMGDLKGLFQTIADVVPLDKQPELMNRIQKGQFSLRDMYEQFQSIQNMGPMSQVMSMIPGMANVMPKGSDVESAKRIRRFMVMMDSMNHDELDCVKPMVHSRNVRVARGSGSSVEEVVQLIEEYKRMSKMVGKMGKSGLMGGKGGNMQEMMRNPQQAMKKMQGALDPKLLQQMGGTDGLMSMMKQMGNMDMKDMMEQMGGGDPNMANMMKNMGMGGAGRGGRRR
eukprot:GEMP01013252.1.p1 GENE.GEMP01013252.1~~GEMP01013252.1.p1  ORF type:complete len:520 (+),score=99.06 GEMP01013252.1:83-1642(+)